MKFFHMADLHLGKKLLGEPLWTEQQDILSRVVAMADEEKPEAVLLCGDIYDKSIPSSEAVGLLDWFLEELSVRGIQTFLISGNHDGAQRLQFARVMRSARFMCGCFLFCGPVCSAHLRRKFRKLMRRP